MKKIVFTGPESVGKSTLTKQVANYYSFPSGQEIARQYFEKRSTKYNIGDVENIAKLQIETEENYSKNNCKVLLLDTDLIVTKIWFIYRYASYPIWIDEHLRKYKDCLHLLCYPDLGWQEDPLRENPDIRSELFEAYRKEIENFDFDYEIIKGKDEIRFNNSIRAIDKFLGII